MNGTATAAIAFAFISARNAAATFIGKETAIRLYVESRWAALPIPISHCRPIPNGRTRSTTGSEYRSLLSTIRRVGPLEHDDGSARDHLYLMQRLTSTRKCRSVAGHRWVPG